ncbi:uncharacterized protein LOC144862576 [Branchiostoma floridae x Branchiostoma japonicum]
MFGTGHLAGRPSLLSVLWFKLCSYRLDALPLRRQGCAGHAIAHPTGCVKTGPAGIAGRRLREREKHPFDQDTQAPEKGDSVRGCERGTARISSQWSRVCRRSSYQPRPAPDPASGPATGPAGSASPTGIDALHELRALQERTERLEGREQGHETERLLREARAYASRRVPAFDPATMASLLRFLAASAARSGHQQAKNGAMSPLHSPIRWRLDQAITRLWR